MVAFNSQVNSGGEEFAANGAAMAKAWQQVEKVFAAMDAGAQKSRDHFHAKGKLLPRERIDLLLDKGSPFIELGALAGYKREDDKDGSAAGGGLIGGIGLVCGAPVLVVANNSAIKGGVISPTGLKKCLRLQEVALSLRLPLITLAESGGANLNYAAEVFVEGARTFANQARLSARGIPQITVVHGNATAGGAYQPGLSDHVVVVRDQTKMFLAGPPLLFAATGEVASDEELGGAALHAAVAGTAEYLAENDQDGIAYARDIAGRILAPWEENLVDARPPLFPAEDLYGIIPHQAKKPFDCREVIARLVDGSDFLEFKGAYDSGTICGYGSFLGTKVGIISNNAPLTCQGAVKAAQFIQLCDQSQLPLLFLHNTTGFMVGTDSEQGGIIKHGSKMIQAVTNARVPKISVIIGGSYGAGNYAMCGRGFDPDFIFTWPNSKISVMGGEQAGKVLRIVTEQKAKRKGQPVDEKFLSQLEMMTKAKMDSESTALYATSRLWDDGIIDPVQTRPILGFLFKVLVGREQREQTNTFGVARF